MRQHIHKFDKEKQKLRKFTDFLAQYPKKDKQRSKELDQNVFWLDLRFGEKFFGLILKVVKNELNCHYLQQRVLNDSPVFYDKSVCKLVLTNPMSSWRTPCAWHITQKAQRDAWLLKKYHNTPRSVVRNRSNPGDPYFQRY